MISLQLLGCSGGIGGAAHRTTCYMLDERILIDAGTGLSELTLEQLARIDHIVLTHAHLDHIACLPLMADSVTELRSTPLQVWALPAVIAILRQHVFNDLVWPDFTKIPDAINPFVVLHPLPETGPLILGDLHFTGLPANHGIPACGYRVQKDNVSLAFSGDTADCPGFWEVLSQEQVPAAVIVECSYPRRMADMALLSRHMDVDTVVKRVRQLPEGVATIIVHRKPGLENEIEQELQAELAGHELRLPQHGQVYKFN
jgi:3',5'-cyclic-nucleotide phosphodiesterase